MRVSNEGAGPQVGSWADVIRLQTEFQLRMADETMRYLRAVQDALAPTVPTSVLTTAPGGEITASAKPGERISLDVDVENSQPVHVTATAALTPLVDASGTTWFPAADPAPTLLVVAPGEVESLIVAVPVPAELPAGEYHGALLLHGFRSDGIPVRVTVSGTQDRPERRKPSANAEETAGASETQAPVSAPPEPSHRPDAS